MKLNTVVYRGFINRDLRVEYVYQFEAEGQWATITQRPNSSIVNIKPSYGIAISEGFDKARLWVPYTKYYTFVCILEKAIKLISEHMFELFPRVGSNEFEVDSRVLQRFQTEQALASNGFTVMPCVWADAYNQCHAGMRISTTGESIAIPLEDALPISKFFNTFDPNGFGLSLLRLLGKIE